MAPSPVPTSNRDPRLPLRWLLMATHVPPEGRLGGIVRYTVELARALSVRDDVELSLLASREAAGPLADVVPGARRIVRLPVRLGPLTPAFERYALGPLLGSAFDVVHGVKHLLPRTVAARTVLTVHDMLLYDRPEDFPTAKRLLLRRPYAASLRQADVLLCISAATQERMAARFPAVASRSTVVPLATSPSLLGSTPIPVPALAGRPFALVVGDPSRRKNLAVVVSAWHRVVRQRPDAVLALVGPPAWGAQSYGPHAAELETAQQLVHLVGVQDGELRWCYEHAAVVLAPSLLEGFGLPAVEALDLGAPLVTSRAAALVEVSGEAAEHLPADDVDAWAQAALRRLARGTAHRTRREARGWDDVAAETVAAVRASAR